MPELPEVEITRSGIAPHLEGRRITGVVVRDARLRWPVTPRLGRVLGGKTVRSISRRGKYLLLDCGSGSLLIHLGMSGSLRIVPASAPPAPHDHVDLIFGDTALRLRDPRRFGAVLWCAGDPGAHKLLAHLGIEPFSEGFGGAALFALSRGRRQSIKQLLMDHRLVVGVGNIYANESLYRAGIRPTRAAGRVTRAQCERLAEEIRATLREAIAAGGSSLRDFVHSDGGSGYFQQSYFVYGRDDETCRRCSAKVRRTVQGQRASFYCPGCQR